MEKPETPQAAVQKYVVRMGSTNFAFATLQDANEFLVVAKKATDGEYHFSDKCVGVLYVEKQFPQLQINEEYIFKTAEEADKWAEEEQDRRDYEEWKASRDKDDGGGNDDGGSPSNAGTADDDDSQD
jgi:hypothetical protein